MLPWWNGRHYRLKICCLVRAGSSPAAATNIIGDTMNEKSSIDYAELAGLIIALSNLQTIDITRRDEEWIAITNWIKARIKKLEQK